MNAWAAELAKYAAVIASIRDPLTPEQCDAAKDALVRLADAHYALLAGAAERAVADLDAMKLRQGPITERSLARAAKGRRP